MEDLSGRTLSKYQLNVRKRLFYKKKVPVCFQACFCTSVFIYEAFIPDSMYGTIGLCSTVSWCTVKAVSVKNINYLYRYGIEASSEL